MSLPVRVVKFQTLKFTQYSHDMAQILLDSCDGCRYLALLRNGYLKCLSVRALGGLHIINV